MLYGLWTAIFLTVCGAALWRGGRDERAAGVAMLIAWLVAVVVYSAKQGATTEWGLLAVDVVLLVALTAIALQSDRYWPLAAAGFQLLTLVGHLPSALDERLGAWVYISGLVIFSYLTVAALAVGTFMQWRRRGRVIEG